MKKVKTCGWSPDQSDERGQDSIDNESQSIVQSPLLALPEPLLDHVVARIASLAPKSTMSLLCTCKALHDAVMQSMYEEVYAMDSEEAVTKPPLHTRLCTVLSKPTLYGHLVKTLVIVPSDIGKQALQIDIDISVQDTTLSVTSLGSLLAFLPCVKTIVWASDRAPPPAFCSTISRRNVALSHLVVKPLVVTGANCAPERWAADDLNALPLLQTLILSLTSAEGIRNISLAAPSMTQLKHLSIDSPFIDDALLVRLGTATLLEVLTLRGNGTKITDKGVRAVLERCQALRSLSLIDVQGRLSKTFWSTLGPLPEHLEEIAICYHQEHTQHSWVAEHLDSALECFKLAQSRLRKFSATSFVARLRYVELNVSDNLSNFGCEKLGEGVYLKRLFYLGQDEVLAPRSLSSQALESLVCNGSCLQRLELDMYQLTIDDLRKILESCRQLRYLRVCLDAPLQRLLGISSAFVGVPHLEKLVIVLPKQHCPLPGLVLRPTESKNNMSADSAAASATLTSTIAGAKKRPLEKATSGSLNSAVETKSKSGIAKGGNWAVNAAANNRRHSESLPNTTSMLSVYDSSIPSKREIRKLAKRCPNLEILRWAGRYGKGEWQISHSKESTLPGIEFIPMPLIDEDESDRNEIGTGADVGRLILGQRLAFAPRERSTFEDCGTREDEVSEILSVNEVDVVTFHQTLDLNCNWDAPSPTTAIREWQRQAAFAESPLSSTGRRSSYAAVVGISSESSSPQDRT